MSLDLSKLKRALRACVSPERRAVNERFFKTGKGEYGYGDKFIGLSDLDCRKVVRQFFGLPMADILELLRSEIHEERGAALRLLVRRFEKGDLLERERVYRHYIKNFRFVNNWDLVDVSAYKIAGAYLLENPKEAGVLEEWARDKNLWKRRLSIVATFAFIRNGIFDWTLKNAETLLPDTHDLTHKAVGWMLREVWKRDHRLVEYFLIKHYNNLPRTTLRYAIEKMEEGNRRRFLKGEFR